MTKKRLAFRIQLLLLCLALCLLTSHLSSRYKPKRSKLKNGSLQSFSKTDKSLKSDVWNSGEIIISAFEPKIKVKTKPNRLFPNTDRISIL